MQFEEFSNVHNSDRISNDRTSRIKLYKNNARSRLFCRIAKRSIDDYAKDGGEKLFTKMHCVL